MHNKLRIGIIVDLNLLPTDGGAFSYYQSLLKGIKEGHVRPDINVKILSRARMENVEMAMNPTNFPPDKFKILDVQLTLVEHFLYGICTLKGHKLINKYKEITEEE